MTVLRRNTHIACFQANGLDLLQKTVAKKSPKLKPKDVPEVPQND